MRKLSTALVCILALNAHANVVQYFAGISYNNPSELFKVKKEALWLGGTGSYADLAFTGSVFNFNTFQYDSGKNHSRTYTVLPYGRFAKRFDEQVVFAIDVTQPFNSNLNWGDNAFTKYAATQNYLRDVDISPKMSFAVSKKLQLGGGVNFNYLLHNEINWAFPTGQFSSANLINKTTSFGVGYNLGLTYLLNDTNFFGLTYYSQIRQRSSGYSVLGGNFSNNLTFAFTMPPTAVISYVHIFNPTWLLSVQVFQSQWNLNQYARFNHTAAPPPYSNFSFEMKFDKAYALLGALRNQFTEKLGLTLAGMIDDGPERNYLRPILFPSDVQYLLGLVGDYHFNANTSVELMYAHVFSYPSIQNRTMVNGLPIPFTTGFVNIDVNVIDLKLKIEA